jgi:hypothetical protein
MKNPIEALADNDQEKTPSKATSDEPAPETPKKKARKKGKLYPSKLKPPNEKFTGRIKSFSLKETALGKRQVKFSLASKKGKTRAYVLKDCETGIERDIFKLLIAAAAAKWKVVLKTDQRDGAGPGVVEIKAYR